MFILCAGGQSLELFISSMYMGSTDGSSNSLSDSMRYHFDLFGRARDVDGQSFDTLRFDDLNFDVGAPLFHIQSHAGHRRFDAFIMPFRALRICDPLFDLFDGLLNVFN